MSGGGSALSLRRAESRRQARVIRKYPVGAELQAGGGVHYRVWAPKSREAAILIDNRSFELESEEDGYFSGLVSEAQAGTRYKIQLDNGAFPDPVSRFQPEGPHGHSQVIDPSVFRWGDQAWKGADRRGQIIYELHVGTFTPEGTWAAAASQLSELAELGVTMLEIMPLADFPGEFGWGYDGVCMFAPTRLYGKPDDVRAFINGAHALGISVILDVVYNHFGPDGNYIREFSEDYFSRKYKNEWGDPINFDDANSGPVREFFVTNARYWIEEFHFDGLRLDATQQIFDESQRHILTEIVAAVREGSHRRGSYVVGENESQHTHLMRPVEQGGYGLDALWNDDFHHSAVVALTGRNEAYYTDHLGKPQEFISAAKYGYLFQGQWYKWQRHARGSPALDLPPEQFVTFIENHDQVANSLRGQRIQELTTPGRLKAMTALLLLGPATPMLFQGQEFAASSPFLFFADHNAELNRLVARGRREFLEQFSSIASSECREIIANPGDAATFRCCKLDFRERERHAGMYQLHKDLIRLRREAAPIRDATRGSYDGAVLGEEAFLLRFFGTKADDRLLLINLGRDLQLNPAPEPLLACTAGADWEVEWSSEHLKYGGGGTPEIEDRENWHIPGHAAILLKPGKRKERANAKTGAKD